MLNQKYSNGLLDFHMHSTHSDGTRNPNEVVEDAEKVGITAIALTDHHIISGLDEFRAACKARDIFAIPFGTEICAGLPQEILTPQDNEAPDLIMLGKNPKTAPMHDYQQMLIKDIGGRIFPETIRGLESIGFRIDAALIARQRQELETQLQVPPKLIHEFIKLPGNFDVFVEFMKGADPKVTREELERKTLKYINKHLFAVGCPAYTRRIEGFDVSDANRLAAAINCKLFIAHPGGEYGFLTDKILDYFIQQGIPGIEVRNYFNTPAQNQKFDGIAREHNLARSGGSDYHGPTGAFKLGIHDRPQNQLPKDILDEVWDNLPD